MGVFSSVVVLALVLSPSSSAGIQVDAAPPGSLSCITGTTGLVSTGEALPKPRAVEAWMIDAPERRPAALLPLYATLGAVQALDAYSSQRAISRGASEANPILPDGAGHTGTMIALKAASTAATIVFAERAWKKNRKGAVILMIAIDGVMAAVSARNLRNASRLAQ